MKGSPLTPSEASEADLPVERFIYFIQQGLNGPVKVGLASRRPDSRLADLQIGNPHELFLIGFLRGGCVEVEQEIHAYFDRFRIRGEWFEPRPLVLSFIERGEVWCIECGAHPIVYGGAKTGRCALCRRRKLDAKAA